MYWILLNDSSNNSTNREAFNVKETTLDGAVILHLVIFFALFFGLGISGGMVCLKISTLV
ncbi:MAG: hypothetical protein E6H07_13185 [Bacteroidetes bacterium]|nr:MAG: hypothetical protein E6H07_13185 [Bacteroidota bacterium]